MVPDTRYARLGDLHLAYKVVGDGPPDILLLDQWFGNLDSQWDVPPLAELRERLASFGRLIMFDKRGTGLSDPIPTSSLPTLEEFMADIPAVLDTVGAERPALIANIGGGILAILVRGGPSGPRLEPHPGRLLRRPHIAARASAKAGASEILVSSTVKDLVVGSGLDFDDRGGHELKGVPGEWRLYAVST